MYALVLAEVYGLYGNNGKVTSDYTGHAVQPVEEKLAQLSKFTSDASLSCDDRRRQSPGSWRARSRIVTPTTTNSRYPASFASLRLSLHV